MKHFINVFITLVLLGLSTGFFYLIENTNLDRSCYGLGLTVVLIYMLLWGCKLYKDY